MEKNNISVPNNMLFYFLLTNCCSARVADKDKFLLILFVKKQTLTYAKNTKSKKAIIFFGNSIFYEDEKEDLQNFI